jgi:hypothetical protein
MSSKANTGGMQGMTTNGLRTAARRRHSPITRLAARERTALISSVLHERSAPPQCGDSGRWDAADREVFVGRRKIAGR